MTVNQFGTISGPQNVETAAIATLQKWFWPTYLEEAERVSGLGAGTIEPPELIYGVFDEFDFINERMPGVMVACTTPSGEPERYSLGTGQQYALVVMCVIRNDDRDVARRDAGIYATAANAVILQQLGRDFPHVVSDVWLTMAPTITLPNPDQRLIYVSRVEFDVFVAPIVIDSEGPLAPKGPGALTGPWPAVTSVNVTVDVVPLDEPLS